MKKYVVDVFRTYAKSVEIEAKDEHEAESIAYKMASEGKLNPRDFEMTEDIDTVCSGMANEDGEREYD